MEFIDYYAVLGVSKNATAEEIQSAYRRLARQYHPDVNKAKDAEEKFKRLGEAFEVLGDPAKRRRYDSYGTAWKQAEAQGAPPPGFEGFRFEGGGSQSFEFGGGDFSEFFEALFGLGAGSARRGGGRARPGRVRPGADAEARIALSLEDAARGGKRHITLQDPDSAGTRTLAVTIPAGILPGQRIRLAGQGGRGRGAGAGDLYLQVEIEAHPAFRLEGRDLHTVLPVPPWVAALGGDMRLRTLDGTLRVKIPPGSSTGRRIRLTGRGFPQAHGGAGDLYAEIRIVVPETLTAEERELYAKLAQVSRFTPPAQHRAASQ